MTTGTVGNTLRAESGTALVLRHKDNRTPVRKVTGGTDKSERVAGVITVIRYQSDIKYFKNAIALTPLWIYCLPYLLR